MNLPCAVTLAFCGLFVQATAAEPAKVPLPKGPFQQIEIAAVCKDFPKQFNWDKRTDGELELPAGVLASPRVTTKAGNRAVIEIVREVRYAINETEFETKNAGVTLEICPTVKDGKVVLSGKCHVVQQLQPGVKQPLNAVTFAIRETIFTGTVPNGEPFTIDVGDGEADKAKVILTAKLLTAADFAAPSAKPAKPGALGNEPSGVPEFPDRLPGSSKAKPAAPKRAK